MFNMLFALINAPVGKIIKVIQLYSPISRISMAEKYSILHSASWINQKIDEQPQETR
jgi:hypothetical protein